MDGSDPATDWQGLTPLADNPHVENPRLGWLYNTNDGPWGGAGPDSPKRDAYPRYVDQLGENARGWHATKLLNEHRGLTLETSGAAMSAFDSYLPAFDRLVPCWSRISTPRPTPSWPRPWRCCRDWDYRWSDHSTATSLAVFWGEALWDKCAAAARTAGVQVLDYMIAQSTPDQRRAALAEAVAPAGKGFRQLAHALGRDQPLPEQ